MKKSLQLLCLLSAIFASVLLVSCGGGGGGGSGGRGTLGVSITDAPACGFDEVNITVTKVRVNQSSSAGPNDTGWTDIVLNPAKKINLVSLTNGALAELGEVPLTPGHYTQLRLVLEANGGMEMANTVVLEGSNSPVLLDTPSAAQSGLKLINEFDVAAGQRVDLVLDFDACKSVVTKGNGKYALKPVIRVIPTVANGIEGFIDTSLLSSHVVVTAQQNGTIIRSTVPDNSGEFFLARLDPGNYDVVITADNHANAVIATVPVTTTTSVVDVSTSGAPISLPNSSSHSISGTISLDPASDTEVGYAAATTSLISGPDITVKIQGADATTGAYTLSNLSIGVHQLGQYTANLPITFADVFSTPDAGMYAVQATANGYTTQINDSVDIRNADALDIDFSLIP